MLIADFLNELADKVGDKNNKGLNNFVSQADIGNIDLPDDFCKTVTSGLMSLEGARNNPKVKSYYKAQALDGIDSEIINAIKEFGIDETLFESESDTYRKLRTLNAKIKELMEKKPEHSDEYKKRYEEGKKTEVELRRQLATVTEQKSTEVAAERERADSHVLNFLKLYHLRGLDFANKELPADILTKVSQAVIDETMSKKGAKVVHDNGALKLVQANDATMEYFDDSHKPVTYEDFVKKVLADNKMLSVTDPTKVNPPAFPTQPFAPGGNPAYPAEAKTLGAMKFHSDIQSSLLDLNPKFS